MEQEYQKKLDCASEGGSATGLNTVVVKVHDICIDTLSSKSDTITLKEKAEEQRGSRRTQRKTWPVPTSNPPSYTSLKYELKIIHNFQCPGQGAVPFGE